MIVLDYIIANEDRHLNNFGVIETPKHWSGSALPPSMTAAPLSAMTRCPDRYAPEKRWSASRLKTIIGAVKAGI